MNWLLLMRNISNLKPPLKVTKSVSKKSRLYSPLSSDAKQPAQSIGSPSMLQIKPSDCTKNFAQFS